MVLELAEQLAIITHQGIPYLSINLLGERVPVIPVAIDPKGEIDLSLFIMLSWRVWMELLVTFTVVGLMTVLMSKLLSLITTFFFLFRIGG